MVCFNCACKSFQTSHLQLDARGHFEKMQLEGHSHAYYIEAKPAFETADVASSDAFYLNHLYVRLRCGH